MTRVISGLLPTEINSLKPEVLKKRFRGQMFHTDRIISLLTADKAEKQCNLLINNSDFFEKARKFNIIDGRVVELYSRILDSIVTLDLENVVRLVLIMFYGNAKGGSDFSLNNSILLGNMLEESIVYENVQKVGSAEDIQVTLEMLKTVKASHRTYKTDQEEKKRDTVLVKKGS